MKLADAVAALTPAQRESLARIQSDRRTRDALLNHKAVREAPAAAAVEAYARVEPDGSVVLAAKGLRLINVANAREHWGARKARVTAEHQVIDRALAAVSLPAGPRWRVEIVREGVQLMDDDGLAISAKGVRDCIAAQLGVDDGPTGPVTWSYAQHKAKGYGVRITIKGVPDGAE